MLVGHSERRHLFAESNSLIAKKFHQVKEHGMIPILCIGETFAEKESGHTASVLDQQLLLISEQGKHCFDNAIIAYEPVWAIGTGITASPAEVQTIHAFIREKINVINRADAAKIPIIYGGSVTEKNAGLLLAEPDIDGVLVGGASLDARRFVEIVKCIN
ncbi:MAG: triose-phosphate isomerase [Legionellales bacterium RIFCSPHIGHO2_12_FULL_42_9]|nr:MAG: triose-phosphate isomerase [Legionellales bacterium RIFCSPHIGHO2_12_FULL_42_9]